MTDDDKNLFLIPENYLPKSKPNRILFGIIAITTILGLLLMLSIYTGSGGLILTLYFFFIVTIPLLLSNYVLQLLGIDAQPFIEICEFIFCAPNIWGIIYLIIFWIVVFYSLVWVISKVVTLIKKIRK